MSSRVPCGRTKAATAGTRRGVGRPAGAARGPGARPGRAERGRRGPRQYCPAWPPECLTAASEAWRGRGRATTAWGATSVQSRSSCWPSQVRSSVGVLLGAWRDHECCESATSVVVMPATTSPHFHAARPRPPGPSLVAPAAARPPRCFVLLHPLDVLHKAAPLFVMSSPRVPVPPCPRQPTPPPLPRPAAGDVNYLSTMMSAFARSFAMPAIRLGQRP